jgi:hypothetical protein
MGYIYYNYIQSSSYRYIQCKCYFWGYKEGGSGSGNASIELKLYHYPYSRVIKSYGVPKGGGWTRGHMGGNMMIEAGDYFVVRMNAGDVGSINRWARYKMEHMDITYMGTKEANPDIELMKFETEFILSDSTSINQPLFLQ